ncbi:MAG: FG-GAP repeat protein, partial [Myxococcota bacterium]
MATPRPDLTIMGLFFSGLLLRRMSTPDLSGPQKRHRTRSSDGPRGGLWAALASGLVGAAACSVGGDGTAPPAPPEPAYVAPQVGPAAPAKKTDPGMTPSLRAAYVLARQRAAGPAYTIAAEADKLVATNPAQALSLSIAEDGVALTPDDGDWSLRFEVDAFGCEGAMEELEAEEPTVDIEQPNQVWQNHGPLSAWYLNGPLGLQQGFEVSERPPCVDTDDLRVSVGVDGLAAATGRDGIVLRNGAGDVAMRVRGLYVTDADGMEVEAELLADDGGVVIEVDAGEAAFPLHIDPLWVQQQTIVGSDTVNNDAFGTSVDISGDSAIVGAPDDDDAGSSSGSAYVFVRAGGVWTEQQKLTASDAARDD